MSMSYVTLFSEPYSKKMSVLCEHKIGKIKSLNKVYLLHPSRLQIPAICNVYGRPTNNTSLRIANRGQG
jgi:hypothetical protein